jgi:hypothetical protein
MTSYSIVDQFLHRVVLGSSFINEFLFDLESSFFEDKKTPTLNRRPVFITGLARAGTTILMRSLYESGQFASLTYDDMPFVMAPNLWKRLASKNKKVRIKTERAHGDGIQVDFDSPEALEEVFWRTFHEKEYIFRNSLRPHEFSSETLHAFEIYQDLVCKKYGKQRYLSKNNNHILRIKSLTSHCKNAKILIAFRDPVEHSRSLLTQHTHFLNSPPFTRTYMNLLAHHEFGDTHRPFIFSVNQTISGDPKSLDYWIDRWSQYYQYVLEFLKQKPENVMLVSYQRLCQDPMYWKEICKFVDIPIIIPSNFSPPPSSQLPSMSTERIENAKKIYKRLEQAAIDKIEIITKSALIS